MKLLDENMAADAFSAVTELGLSADELDGLETVAKGFPAMLLSNGLATALSVAKGKEGDSWSRYRALLEQNADLREVMGNLDLMRDMKAAEYLRLVQVASSWAGWLKRILAGVTPTPRSDQVA